MASAEVLNASEAATEPQLIREEGALVEPKKGGDIDISLEKENGDALDVVGNEPTVDASQHTIVNVKVCASIASLSCRKMTLTSAFLDYAGRSRCEWYRR
jgi:hypothetical protein